MTLLIDIWLEMLHLRDPPGRVHSVRQDILLFGLPYYLCSQGEAFDADEKYPGFRTYVTHLLLREALTRQSCAILHIGLIDNLYLWDWQS
jgi:hypothetical protein